MLTLVYTNQEALTQEEELDREEASIKKEEYEEYEDGFQNPSNIALESGESDEVCMALDHAGLIYANRWSRSSAIAAMLTSNITSM